MSFKFRLLQIAFFYTMFYCAGVFAYSCDVGYYTMCFRDPGNYDNCTDCSCEACPSGQTSNGLGVVYEENCPGHYSSNNGCYDLPLDKCSGYDNCPSGVGGNGKKCKLVSGCPDGCGKYEICDTATGSVTNDVSGECHLEGDSCYSNTRACKEFDVAVTGGAGEWTCKKEYQTGNAYWYPESWDVGGCECNKSGISTDGCADGVVRHSRQDNFISSVTDKITYKQTRRYCKKCVPGKVPKKESAQQSSIWYQPQGTTSPSWGVYKCETVSAPYFALGCVINWGETNWSIATVGCQMSCGSSLLTITTNGATSDAACVPDGLQEYSDDTGTFTLGTDKCQ